MKFLVLSYGAEDDWLALSDAERRALLAQDEVLERRGDFVAPLENRVVTVRSPDARTTVEPAPFAASSKPLAGFGIIEAEAIEEVVGLVEGSPCARAGGAVEIRPFYGS